MLLRHIAIRDFRKIGHRDIDGLADGLNVLVGDNEAGKSTVLAALRAAFFERHRVSGAVADAMLPYGSAVRPTVTVDFEIDGRSWSLTKAFCQRPEASLEGPGERHTGDAVEERLALLLGFTPPGRGASNPREHHGAHGLLWVEQGLRVNLGVGAGRDTIAGALEREIGEVTGGERGRALLLAAAERRERFWDRRDKPRGAVAEARRTLEAAEGEHAALLARLRELDARIARLDIIGTSLDRHRRDDHLGRAVAAVALASRAVQDTARHEALLTAAVAGREAAMRQVSDARERRDRRAALVARRDQALAGAGKAAVAAEEARLLARHRAVAAREADRALDGARHGQDEAEGALRGAEAAAQRRDATAALTEQQLKLAAAEDQAARRRAALARVDAIALDGDGLAALNGLERAVDRARAELDAASVQITFTPDGARRILLDGVEQAVGEPLALTRDASMELEGFGRLHLRPGGGTAVLRRKLDEAERALRAALARTGMTNTTEARRLVQLRGDAGSEAAALAKTLAVLAPQGVDALRQAVEAGAARLDGQDVGLEAPDAAGLAALQRERDATRLAVQTREAARRAAAAADQAAAMDAATLDERRAAALHQAEALSNEVAAARGLADDDLLAGRLATAEALLAASQAAEATAAAAVAASDVEATRLTLERSERAEREIRRDLATLEGEQRDLRVELRAIGQDGLGERLSAIEGEIEAGRSRLGALEREAAASRLLHEALLQAQRDAKERWLGPVRDRITPYLRLIHPESEVRLDDQSLEIEGLYRDGVLEQFGALSMGAREQVAVVTRLALAEILKSAGHPAAVILDDALVNTDDARLDRMRNVLTRAARGLQILILTCRERDFLGLGATHRI